MWEVWDDRSADLPVELPVSYHAESCDDHQGVMASEHLGVLELVPSVGFTEPTMIELAAHLSCSEELLQVLYIPCRVM